MSTLAFNSSFPGKNNFLVGSNLTTFFSIGDFLEKKDFYIIGWHDANGEFFISAKILTSEGKPLIELKNNQLTYNFENSFMLETVEDRHGTLESMKITDKTIIPIYAQKNFQQLNIDGQKKTVNVTEIHGRFHNNSGELKATGTKHGLILHNVKSVVGATKSGSLGMVLYCSKDEIEYIRNFVREFL